VPLADLCGRSGPSLPASFEQKANYGGLDVSEAWQLKVPEDLLGINGDARRVSGG